jgi:hypothetical protein
MSQTVASCRALSQLREDQRLAGKRVIRSLRSFSTALPSIETHNKFPGACERRIAICNCFEIFVRRGDRMGTSNFRNV